MAEGGMSRIVVSQDHPEVLTLRRVEVAGHIVFIREGEKPRIRVKMGRN
jgi:hypothetical protein